MWTRDGRKWAAATAQTHVPLHCRGSEDRSAVEKSTGAVGLVSFDFIDARIHVAALRLALLSSAQQLPE